MTLIDKFGILNQSSLNDKIRIDSVIDNYLENLIINNDYVLSPNIVHKNIWEVINLKNDMTNENIKLETYQIKSIIDIINNNNNNKKQFSILNILSYKQLCFLGI